MLFHVLFVRFSFLPHPASKTSCNALFSGFKHHKNHLQSYANEQLATSYDYLLLASHFGTYVNNRPGFEKQFLALSNKAWENTIDLIKYITKRGGEHDFFVRADLAKVHSPSVEKALELSEIEALSYALESEKTLSLEAHRIHEVFSRHHRSNDTQKADEYDPEVAHYLEEKFLEDQAETIRKLSGYTNDLKGMIKNEPTNKQFVPLNVYLFDEYLATQ